jgi:glycosyltransferase involved in cell wall biosynthesis
MDITEWPFLTIRHWKWFVTLMLWSADRVLTIKTRSYFSTKFHLRQKSIITIEHCPDPEMVASGIQGKVHYRPPAGSFVVCCSGAAPQHRLERFLVIFEKLLALVPGAKLLIIADPERPLVRFAKEYAQTAGFSECITYLPFIKPIEDFFATVKQCDLWVATMGDDTLQGGLELRMELLELGLLGKAVVAAPTEGLKAHELLDGKHLIYVDPREPDAAASRLAMLAGDRGALEDLGRELQQVVRARFSLRTAVDSLLKSLGVEGPTFPVASDLGDR